MTPADAILAIIADAYDHNPAFRASLAAELYTLGTIPIPEGSAERVWMRVQADMDQAVESTRPLLLEGIAARIPFSSPDRPRPAIRGAGSWKGARHA
jgi:hypothetical protein